MDWVVSHLHRLFAASPELALFLCLALGYRLGKISFGKFQLGGVAGSLLVAVLVSQVGVTLGDHLKNVLFALFIYAVGFESGPQFFRSLNRKSIREIFLALCLAVTGLATVVILAKLFHLDKGLAAGVAAGGLTQSAIIGTAGDAIAKLGLAADQVTKLQQNVAIGYAVTYVFGSFGAIIICVNILPRFMGKSIHDDAVQAEALLAAGLDILNPDEELAVRNIVGRVYELPANASMTVAELESSQTSYPVTVEKVKRAGKFVDIAPNLALQAGDKILVVGSLDAIGQKTAALGREVYNADDMQLRMHKQDVVLTSNAFAGKKVDTIKDLLTQATTHGVYVLGLFRDGKPVQVTATTELCQGDVVSVYGSEQDVARASSSLGHVIVKTDKTDFVYMGLGMMAGLLIGLLTVRIAGLPLTLGSGGGALLSGLVFGWLRGRRPTMDSMPSGAIQFLKDFGLAGFVVIVGLASGLQAVKTIKESGLSLFLVGVLVTCVPLLLTMVVGKYLLGYKNSAVLAGALSGSRSANPAFGEVLNKAGNSIPTVPFAITYALANVFLTLLGPLVVSLV